MECVLCNKQYTRKSETTFKLRLNNRWKDVNKQQSLQTDQNLSKHAKFILTEQLKWYQRSQGTTKIQARKTWRLLDSKIKNCTTTQIQCWTEFPKSLAFLNFLWICFSESHMQKKKQHHNVTMSNTWRQICNFISWLKMLRHILRFY